MVSGEHGKLHSLLASEKTVEWILKCFLMFVGSILLIVPSGLLLLGGLTKEQSFGVITGFTILFCIVTMLSKDWEMYKTLLAVFGYCAVLYTISAQWPGMNS